MFEIGVRLGGSKIDSSKCYLKMAQPLLSNNILISNFRTKNFKMNYGTIDELWPKLFPNIIFMLVQAGLS